MYIYLIKRIDGLQYDQHAGMVVCAATEKEARIEFQKALFCSEPTNWDNYSCERIGTADAGKNAGVVIEDIRAG